MKGKAEEAAFAWSKVKSEGRGEDGLWKRKRQLKKKVMHFWLLQARGEDCMKEREIRLWITDNGAFQDRRTNVCQERGG